MFPKTRSGLRYIIQRFVAGIQAKNSSEEYSLAILLPHESLHSLLKVNTAEALLQQQAEILPDRPDLEKSPALFGE